MLRKRQWLALCGTASAVAIEGRFTTRDDSVSLTGGEFFDGPLNFSTSQNPPGAMDGEGRFYFVTPAQSCM